MKYLKNLLVFLPICFLGLSPINFTSKVLSTNCHQTFHFFFLSQRMPTFWIGEDLSGECQYSKLLNISIDDSIVLFSQTQLKEYKNWGNFKEISSLFRIFNEKPLTVNDNVWENKDLKIKPPEFDSLLAEEFKEHIRQGGSNAYSWLKLKGDKGIRLPKIEGIQTKLLFSYNQGLYINYKISEVHYFPNAFLLVFTNQPQKAVGLDTMHGFLIFKIIKDKQ